MICTVFWWFLHVLIGKASLSRLSPKYFESSSLFRIFHVHMYTLFLPRSKSSRRNIRFTVENTVENMVIQVLCVWIERFPLIHLMFSTICSAVNQRFLLEQLIFSKKNVYMKNAEGRAGFEIFWRKS